MEIGIQAKINSVVKMKMITIGIIKEVKTKITTEAIKITNKVEMGIMNLTEIVPMDHKETDIISQKTNAKGVR